MLYMNLFLGIYVAAIRPYKMRQQNNREIFNEYFIFNASLSMTVFTNWVPEVENQEFIGFILIGITIFVIVINLGIIIFQSLKSLVKHMNDKYTEHQRI